MKTLATVKIESKKGAGGYVIINEADYDPKKDKLFTEEEATEKQRSGKKGK